VQCGAQNLFSGTQHISPVEVPLAEIADAIRAPETDANMLHKHVYDPSNSKRCLFRKNAHRTGEEHRHWCKVPTDR